MTIHVRNWEKYQHRDVTRAKSTPPWIKDYTRQLSDDDYLSLSFHLRGILQGLRLEYARAGRGLPDNTATLSRRLGQRVMRRDLASLEEAGFIARQTVDTLATAHRQRDDSQMAKYPQRTDTPPTTSQEAAKPRILPAASQPPASLEERREEQTVRSNGSVDVAAPLDLDELEAWQPDEKPAETETNVVELDSRRPQGEINGKPLADVVGPLLDGLHARAQSP